MITLTQAAIEKIESLQAERELESMVQGNGVSSEAGLLRVAVRPGGCSGFSYDMYWDFKGIQQGDIIFAEHPTFIVVVDPESLTKLDGAILDYKESLQGAGFSWNNPNVQRSCGCGQSFS